MRLAYLTPQYPKVSHTFIRREIAALEARGHEIERISIRTPEESLFVHPEDEAERARTFFVLAQGPLALALAVLAVGVTRPAAAARGLALALGSGRGSGTLRAFAYFAEACLLLRRLEARGIAHVHVHFGTNAATVALVLARLGGPSFSVTVHGPDELDAPLGHALAAKVAAARFVAGISDFTAAQLRRWSDPAHWARIRVVHCSVDERFFAAARPIAPDARELVCVGRLCAQKGQLVLVEAFARLAAERPDARLVLAGDGEMRADLERAIARLGLSERVRITGWVDEAKVRELVLAARGFVLPSFAEGLPVSIMEAFALGRPVISTYVAGIPELVRPGENGWLVPAGNVDALALAMRELVDAPSERLDALGAAGARAVRERHSADTEAARLERILEEALKTPRGA